MLALVGVRLYSASASSAVLISAVLLEIPLSAPLLPGFGTSDGFGPLVSAPELPGFGVSAGLFPPLGAGVVGAGVGVGVGVDDAGAGAPVEGDEAPVVSALFEPFPSVETGAVPAEAVPVGAAQPVGVPCCHVNAPLALVSNPNNPAIPSNKPPNKFKPNPAMPIAFCGPIVPINANAFSKPESLSSQHFAQCVSVTQPPVEILPRPKFIGMFVCLL